MTDGRALWQDIGLGIAIALIVVMLLVMLRWIAQDWERRPPVRYAFVDNLRVVLCRGKWCFDTEPVTQLLHFTADPIQQVADGFWVRSRPLRKA